MTRDGLQDHLPSSSTMARSTIRNGLDIAALQKHRKETGSITGFAGGEDMDKTEAMFLRLRRAAPRRHRERDHLRRMPTASAARSSAKAPTAPPRRWPTRSWPTRRSSSFPTFWPMPAASPSPTSNGCRIARASSGTSSWSTSAWRRSWSKASTPWWSTPTSTQREQPHRRLHAGARPRGATPSSCGESTRRCGSRRWTSPLHELTPPRR